MTLDEARPLNYRWAGRDEWMLVQDAPGRAHVVLVQPLFAEHNRCRRLLRDVMRCLARQGVASSLPDLPGTGESRRPLVECSWDDWTGALAAAAVAAAPDVRYVASLRGGALLDGAAMPSSRWRLAPAAGASLLRDLSRARTLDRQDAGEPGEMAGYRISSDLIDRLGAATPDAGEPLRTVRLSEDDRLADTHITGPALWRRAEPGASPELAEAIAADIAAWIATCAA